MDKMPPVGDTCKVGTTLAAVNFDYWSLAPTTSCSFPCSIFSLSLTSVLLLLLKLAISPGQPSPSVSVAVKVAAFGHGLPATEAVAPPPATTYIDWVPLSTRHTYPFKASVT